MLSWVSVEVELNEGQDSYCVWDCVNDS
jgi:hypothetical protein